MKGAATRLDGGSGVLYSSAVGRVQGKVQAAPECQAKIPKIIFPLRRVKLLTDLQISGGELHCVKCVWRPSSARTGWGSYSASPASPSRYSGEGREGKERVGKRERVERGEGKDVKEWGRMGRGSEGKEEGESGREIEGPQRGGSARLGYLSRGRRLPSYAAGCRWHAVYRGKTSS